MEGCAYAQKTVSCITYPRETDNRRFRQLVEARKHRCGGELRSHERSAAHRKVAARTATSAITLNG